MLAVEMPRNGSSGAIMIATDANQLHRIERSIAALECRSARDQMRLQCMLKALRLEQLELLGLNASTGGFLHSLGLA